jgi:hypothetical protein
MFSFGNPSDILSLLDSGGIVKADAQSFSKENVEVLIRAIEAKRLDILYRFEDKAAGGNVINLWAIEFETEYRLSNESKYFHYIANLINIYKTKECDLRIYFTVIYWPSVFSNKTFQTDYKNVSFTPQRIFLSQIDKDKLLSDLDREEQSGLFRR